MRESIAGFAVRALGVAVAGTLIACSGGTGPADETVLFEDDFSSGTLAKWIVSGPGTTADDTFVVTPIGADIATVHVNGRAPLVTTNNSGSPTINAAGGGFDTLEVNLSAASETVMVNSSLVSVVGRQSLPKLPVSFGCRSALYQVGP